MKDVANPPEKFNLNINFFNSNGDSVFEENYNISEDDKIVFDCKLKTEVNANSDVCIEAISEVILDMYKDISRMELKVERAHDSN